MGRDSQEGTAACGECTFWLGTVTTKWLPVGYGESSQGKQAKVDFFFFLIAKKMKSGEGEV